MSFQVVDIGDKKIRYIWWGCNAKGTQLWHDELALKSEVINIYNDENENDGMKLEDDDEWGVFNLKVWYNKLVS